MEECVVTIFPSNAKYKNRAKLVLTQMITDRKKELIFLQFQNCLNLFVKSPTFPPRMEGIRCSANYVPLTPISFLERSALAYGDRCSVVYGNIRFTWKQTLDRCTRLASALVRLGVSCGDVVAALSPNVPALYELHFGAPMAGAVVCALNTKFDSTLISELLTQSDAKVLCVDYQFFHIAKEALEIMSNTQAKLPILVLIAELDQTFINTQEEIVSSPSMLEYETLLVSGETGFEIKRPKDEWDPISLNFTSGTTSRPKGVIYSHRGAYLNSLAAILLSDMVAGPIYLWFVPMFHCSGWCFTWAVAAQGGTNICHRSITAEEIFDTISRHKVTHMGGAPTVLNMLINRPANGRTPLPGKVTVMTGGAPPPPHVLHQMGKLGFTVTHCYGSTETYGPATVCMFKPEWNSLPLDENLKFSARQGLRHLAMEEVDIKDPVTMNSVPSDARTIGEVMLRGNTVMKGYLKNFKATQEAFKGGWFRTGDLGVKHPDGYIELKDRSKDIIVSGGKYISTIEIESVLFNHPAVLEAAVVGRLDDHLGEAPCAFVKLKDGVAVSEEDIIKFCGEQLPNYMAPRTVVFADLPKTSTGKTQKYVLREKAKAMGSI